MGFSKQQFSVDIFDGQCDDGCISDQDSCSHFLKQPTNNGILTNVETMKLLVTGSSGFIGQHLLRTLAVGNTKSNGLSLVTLPRHSLNLLSENAAQMIFEKVQPTHVLHLAWASTAGSNYDEGVSHEEWSESTLSMISHLSSLGVVNWGVGTGLENDANASVMSPYGVAKLQLKESVLNLDSSLSRWISMPYIFSTFHERPRVVRSCLQSDLLKSPDSVHDYLEVRDVAFQLAHMITNQSERVASITSRRMTSNSDFCLKVKEKMTHQIFQSCSCVDDAVRHHEGSPDFYTTLFLK